MSGAPTTPAVLPSPHSIRFVLCARDVIIDQQTNNLTVYSIAEQFNVAAFPVVVPELKILAMLDKNGGREAGRANLAVALANIPLFAQPIDFDFSGKDRTRLIVGLQGLVLATPGQLSFTLTLENGAAEAFKVEVGVANPGPVLFPSAAAPGN